MPSLSELGVTYDAYTEEERAIFFEKPAADLFSALTWRWFPLLHSYFPTVCH